MVFDLDKTYPNEMGRTQQCAQHVIIKYLKNIPNSSWDKFQGNKYSGAGFSDLVGHVDGRIAYIEIKKTDGKPTPAQIAFISEKKSTGANAGFAKSIQDAIDIINGGFGREFKSFTYKGIKYQYINSDK